MATVATPSDDRHALVLAWLREQSPAEVVALCAGADAGVAAGRVGVWLETCLAEVPPYRLVDLAVASRGVVLVEAGSCQADLSGCAALATLAPGRMVVSDALAPAEADASGAALIDVGHPPVSRRSLFRAAGTPVVAHAPDDDDQTRLVTSLRALGDASGTAPARVLTVSGCTACGVCVQACPHDALTLKTEQGWTTLAHLPDRCRGEVACVTHCPESAIVAGEGHAWEAVLSGVPEPLARLRTSRCDRCGATIPAGAAGGVCGPCSRRRAEPFGWDVPAHLRDRLPTHVREALERRGQDHGRADPAH